MMILRTIFIFGLALTSFACSKYSQDLQIEKCIPGGSFLNHDYSQAGIVQNDLELMVSGGVPGVAIAIYGPEGWWGGAAGLAKIEENIPMQICHLHYLQSISKTYMAVAILQLAEQGRIDLNKNMNHYLPEKYLRYLPGTDGITIRMLLNHTSGLPEYNFDPAYVSCLLQHPDHFFKPEDFIGYLEGKSLDFLPGSRYSYRNTNFVILALIADSLTGDHSNYIAQNIFKPLGLQNTFYRNDKQYPDYPYLVNSYWDRYSDGLVENASQFQRNNVATLIGDDGIICNPVDAVKFLRGLMEGHLLDSTMLQEMQTWVLNDQGVSAYGLGLAHVKLDGIEGVGHSGGGIGAGCELVYIPEKETYIFLAINLGTVTGSPIHKNIESVRDKIYFDILK